MYVKLFEQFQDDIDKDALDQVIFGNTTREIMDEMEADCPVKKWYVEKGFAEEFVRKAPKNSSKETVQDLEEIMARMEAVNSDDMAFSRTAEESHEQMFIDFLRTKGIETDMGEVQRTINITDPLCFYLKDRVNRPRPNTLARYYNVKMYPLIHTDANTASYPSGHATSCYTLSKYFGDKYPQHAGEIETFAQRIINTRIQMGIHFPSDITAAKKMVETVYKAGFIK